MLPFSVFVIVFLCIYSKFENVEKDVFIYIANAILSFTISLVAVLIFESFTKNIM